MGDLPTRGGFAVVLPAGQGRVLRLYSWGYPGQIADLARMPALACHGCEVSVSAKLPVALVGIGLLPV